MIAVLKSFFFYLLTSVGVFLALVLFYNLVVWGLSRIPVNKDHISAREVSVYILSNGVHTDIVFPLKNPDFDWTTVVHPEDTKGKDLNAQFVAFGWGDKGFYLETPTWGDITFRTAFNALFGLSTSALHTTFYSQMKEGKLCKKIEISRDDYKQMVQYVLHSFQKQADGKSVLINTDANYGSNDAFYEALGSYSLYFTCNTWTNQVLKTGKQRAGIWTLYDEGIFWHYR